MHTFHECRLQQSNFCGMNFLSSNLAFEYCFWIISFEDVGKSFSVFSVVTELRILRVHLVLEFSQVI